MVELLKSEDFKRWYSGEVEEKYVYHFKKNLPTPEFFNIRFFIQGFIEKFETSIPAYQCCQSDSDESRFL